MQCLARDDHRNQTIQERLGHPAFHSTTRAAVSLVCFCRYGEQSRGQQPVIVTLKRIGVADPSFQPPERSARRVCAPGNRSYWQLLDFV